jgi:hypothetical protein
MIRSSVVLPQPDGPTMHSSSCVATPNVTSSSTRRAPNAWLTRSTVIPAFNEPHPRTMNRRLDKN